MTGNFIEPGNWSPCGDFSMICWLSSLLDSFGFSNYVTDYFSPRCVADYFQCFGEGIRSVRYLRPKG